MKQLLLLLSLAFLPLPANQPNTATLVKRASATYLAKHKTKNPSIKSSHDLVDITTIIPGVQLDIVYATKNNFTRSVVYAQAKCYLRRSVANALLDAQQEFKKLGYSVKVWDAYRPFSIQKKFWELCPDPRYVADPAKGSKHNRGAAVDITLIDLKTNKELVMPSAFDDFSEKAHLNYTAMSPEAAKNCRLLQAMMIKHGFISQPNEWWHFDYKSWKTFDLLDIPFSDLS